MRVRLGDNVKLVEEGDTTYIHVQGAGRGFLRVPLQRYQVVVEEDAKYVEIENPTPWHQVVAFISESGGAPVVPYAEGDVAEALLPLVVLEEEKTPSGVKRTFLGYHVVYKNGRVTSVMGAGMYTRLVPDALADYEPLIPAVKVKDYTELTDGERRELARLTPPELIAALDTSGYSALVAAVIAEILRTDPLALARADPKVVEKYLTGGGVDPDTKRIVEEALSEESPEILEVLEQELVARGAPPGTVALVVQRLEEEREEKEKEEEERRREEEEKTLDEEKRRREEEEARKRIAQVLEDLEDEIKKVFGVTLPITVAIAVPVVMASRATRSLRGVEAREIEEAEEEA